jgi:5-(carboxyamino)imidazole ribonucleotide mutase
MVASLTPLPVIGVPVESHALKGMDSLLSIVQMPKGVPVATVAIGNGRNAGLLAVRILATTDPALAGQLDTAILLMENDVLRRNESVRRTTGRPE